MLKALNGSITIGGEVDNTSEMSTLTIECGLNITATDAISAEELVLKANGAISFDGAVVQLTQTMV